MNELSAVFQIGAFAFRLHYPAALPLPDCLRIFAAPSAEPQYEYHFRLCSELPVLEGERITRREDLLLLRCDGLEYRYTSIPGQPQPYGVYAERDSTHADIYYLEAQLPLLASAPVFISLFALEKRMLSLESLVLHCCYTVCGDTAILFSGASGAGKSTQGALWERYASASVVNGDRALLRRESADGEARWLACGWPVSGSSGICENRSAPIKALVMVVQAKENSVTRLRPMAAFTRVLPQITMNRWDAPAAEQAMSLTEALVTSIPVYELRCDISSTAVDTLKAALSGTQA